MKIYLDDKRETPEGFIRTYSVEETIKLIKENNGNIEAVSLDNDLGTGYLEGYKVVDWIEEQAYNNTLQPIPHLLIHTDNPVAMDRMMQARHNAWKYWEGYGYSRVEYMQKEYD